MTHDDLIEFIGNDDEIIEGEIVDTLNFDELDENN